MFLGTLDDLRPRTIRLPAVVVRPFVALLDRNEPLELSPEVALAFWIPFRALSLPDSWQDDTVFARGIQINARVFHHDEHRRDALELAVELLDVTRDDGGVAEDDRDVADELAAHRAAQRGDRR